MFRDNTQNSGSLFKGNSEKQEGSLFKKDGEKSGMNMFGSKDKSPSLMFGGGKEKTGENIFGGTKEKSDSKMFGGDKGKSGLGLFGSGKEKATPTIFGEDKDKSKTMFGGSTTGGDLFGSKKKEEGLPKKEEKTMFSVTSGGLFGKKDNNPSNPSSLFGNKQGTSNDTKSLFKTQTTQNKDQNSEKKDTPVSFSENKKKMGLFGMENKQKTEETVDTKKKLGLGMMNPINSLGNTTVNNMMNNTTKEAKPNIFKNTQTSESSGKFDFFKPKKVEETPTTTTTQTKPKLFDTKPQNPLDTLDLKTTPEPKKMFNFNAPSKPTDNNKLPNFGTTNPQAKAPGDSATFNFAGTKGKTSLFSGNTTAKSTLPGQTNQTNPVTPGGNIFKSDKTKPGINLGQANTNQQVKAPTSESIHLEKFNNKRVLEIHNEWEDITQGMKNDIKKLGVYMNQNEDDFRRANKTIEELKASQRFVSEEQKFLDGTLDKIISNQSNIESQLDIMDRELQNVLNQNNFSQFDQYDSDDLFAEAHVINKKLRIHERAREEFTHEINGQNSGDNLDDQFNKTINNFFESLGIVETQMDHIDKRLMSSFGLGNYV